MQIAYVTVPETWTLLESLISTKLGVAFTFDVNKTYLLESRGQGNLLGGTMLLLSDALPTDNNAGNFIDNNGIKTCRYGQGTQNLYVKLFRTSLPSGLNISTIGE